MNGIARLPILEWGVFACGKLNNQPGRSYSRQRMQKAIVPRYLSLRCCAGSSSCASTMRRLVWLRATPHEVALGCAAGLFAARLPFFGFQMVLAGALAFMRRVNVPAALIGKFVGNPITWPAIWSASNIAGAWLLSQIPALAADHIVAGAIALNTTLNTQSPEPPGAGIVNL